MLACPDCAGGGLGRARAVSWQGFLFSHVLKDLLAFDPISYMVPSQ